MKRTKYLALVLVVAIALMGAGYAAWNDTLILKNSIKTGNLNVEWVRSYTSPDENWFKGNAWKNYSDASTIDNHFFGGVSPQTITESNGFAEVKSTFNGNVATYEIEKLYPGAVFRWDGTIKNVGDIPVKFKEAKISYDNTDGLLKYLEVIEYKINKGSATGQWMGLVSLYGFHGKEGMKDPFPLSKLAEKLNSDTNFKNTTLLTNETFSFGDPDAEEVECIIIRVKDNLPNEFQNKYFTFDLELIFGQANLD